MAPLLNTPGLQLRKLSIVSVTPDHIDVFSLRSTPRSRCMPGSRLCVCFCFYSTVVIRISSPLHSFFIYLLFFFFFIILFYFIYFIIFNYILIFIYLTRKKNESGASGFRTPNLPIMWPALCPLCHGGTPDTRRLTSEEAV